MYQFLKDFAGPFATVIAAVAAVCVTVYFGRHQKMIAEEQAHIASEKLRHDLYDRRYRVFDAARRLLAQIVSQKNASDDALRAFVIDTDDAVFLFDDDMAAQLKEIHKRAQRLQFFQHQIESTPVGHEGPTS
jgi:L-rhamnose isomerase